MKLWIAILSLLSFSFVASAETTFTPNGGTTARCTDYSGTWWPARSNGICYSSDKNLGSIGFIAAAGATAKCPEGYELIRRASGQIACAQNVIDPIQ